MKPNTTPLTLLLLGLATVGMAQNKPATSAAPAATTASVRTFPTRTGNIQLNRMTTWELKTPTQSEAERASAMSADNFSVKRTVLTDGLGRTMQLSVRRPNAFGKNQVQSFWYEPDGSADLSFLPYTVASGGETLLRDVEQTQRNSYNNEGYSAEQFLYASTMKENSPLQRPLKSMPAGNSWVGTENGKEQQTTFMVNTDLLRFQLNASGNPFVSGHLRKVWCVTSKDEDAQNGSGINRQYYNALGQLLCTEVQGNGSGELLRTYFVYDTWGSVRYRITPKAVEAILANNNTIGNDVLENLCFETRYDALGRTAASRLPEVGKAVQVFDNMDRVVVSQDALMRQQNQWLFTKYDVLNRPVQSGIFTGVFTTSQSMSLTTDEGQTVYYPANATVAYTRELLQNIASSQVTNSNAFLEYLINTKVKSVADYQTSFGGIKVLTTYYYDTYPANSLGFGTSSAASTEGYKPERSQCTQGMLTGKFLAVSDSSGNTQETYYYNERGERIQEVYKGVSGQIRVQAYGYDFAGRLTKRIVRLPGELSIYRKLQYDVYDRLVQIQHKINGNNYRTISRYTYDDLGRLRQRKLGGMNYNVNYDYNIRNWITGINKNFAQTKNTTDYFGMEIFYDKGFDQTFLNGKIAGIIWRSKGTSGEQRAYGYTYDFAGRLKHGDYHQISEQVPSWSKDEKDFTTSGLEYDANGNILAMEHMGLNDQKKNAVMDKLSYSYATNSNRLLGVTELSGSESTDPAKHDGLPDFRDGGTGTDFGYDANGNQSADQNRGIVNIANNWFGLNKPLLVEFANNNRIDYVYDAEGTLLRKKITQALNNQTTTYDYVGEVTYRNGSIDGMLHEEGRVRTDASSNTFTYDYFVRDHLQNVRAIIAESQVDAWASGTPINSVNWSNTTNTTDGTELSNPEQTASTTTPDPVYYLATSEIQYDTLEEEFFDHLDDTRYTRPLTTDSSNYFAAKLSASEGKIIGPGIMLQVMAGDRIQLGLEALYFSNTNPGNPLPIQNLATSILSALGGGGLLDAVGAGAQAASMDLASMTMALNQLKGSSDTTLPSAYLNYLFFDESMKVVPEESGQIQITQANAWSNLAPAPFELTRTGYLYVFSSNVSTTSVRTDNLFVSHYQGSLLEEFHYYPFGMCFEVSKSPALANGSEIRYNSQVIEQDEFTDASGNLYGIDRYDFAARGYDPQLGRWLQPDPLAQHSSPYLAMSNNPTLYTDPLGLMDDGDPDYLVNLKEFVAYAEMPFMMPSMMDMYLYHSFNSLNHSSVSETAQENWNRFKQNGKLDANGSFRTSYRNNSSAAAVNQIVINNPFNQYLLEYDAIKKKDKNKSSGSLNLYSVNLNGSRQLLKTINAVSGSNNLFTIPEGSWYVDNHRIRTRTEFTIDGVGFSFDIGPDGQFGRTLLRIHPDGGAAGTAGCIGVLGTSCELTDFENSIAEILTRVRRIDLNVIINESE